MNSLAISLVTALGLAVAAVPAFADVAPVPPPPAQSGSRCINPSSIDHTKVLDDNTILFYLHGGETLRNTLLDKCIGLRLSTRGFTYVVRGGEICGNLQSIKVNDTGAICQLGPFTPEPPQH